MSHTKYKVLKSTDKIYWYLECFDCKQGDIDKAFVSRDSDYMFCNNCATKVIVCLQCNKKSCRIDTSEWYVNSRLNNNLCNSCRKFPMPIHRIPTLEIGTVACERCLTLGMWNKKNNNGHIVCNLTDEILCHSCHCYCH